MTPLPFHQTAELRDQSGNTLAAAMPISLWPAGINAATPTGEAYDFTGECPVGFADELVGKANRQVIPADGAYAGRVLKVLLAEQHDFVPHLALTLREQRPGG